jgi:dolichol-phosphate mannosyltransferase
MTKPTVPQLCVIAPAFNEEANLPALHRELAAALDARGITFTLLIVDDGSRDDTPAQLRKLVRMDNRIRALRLSRHFGHQEAISVGLNHARGTAVAVMDADLQDRPEDLLLLYDRWLNGADVVYAVRRTRPEGFVRQLSYRLFYATLTRLSEVPIPEDAGDFCVMDAAFVERLNALPERLRFARGLRAWLGGRQVAVPVDRGPRRHGDPQHSTTSLVRLALDGFLSFSDAPLRLASIAGAIVSGLAFLGAIVVLGWKLTGKLPAGAGVATIALGVFLLGGVQLLTIGVLGEYVGRIFSEVKNRPIAVIAEVISADPGWSSAQTGHTATVDTSGIGDAGKE